MANDQLTKFGFVDQAARVKRLGKDGLAEIRPDIDGVECCDGDFLSEDSGCDEALNIDLLNEMTTGEVEKISLEEDLEAAALLAENQCPDHILARQTVNQPDGVLHFKPVSS